MVLSLVLYDCQSFVVICTNNVVFSYFLELGEVYKQYLSQGYIETLPHMQSEMGQWEGFVVDNNVRLFGGRGCDIKFECL